MPGAFRSPAHSSQHTPEHAALTMIDDHKEEIAMFRQTVDVEKALKKQVVDAIDKLHLKELCVSQTDTITKTVAEFLTHIFASYVLVDATKIAKEEQKVDLMVWNLNNPPFIVFSVVR